MSRDTCDLLCLDLERAEALRLNRLEGGPAKGHADQAKALSDPTRLTLAVALAGTDELCVCDLSWVMERAENLVSHHLRVLAAAELVERRRDGKMVLYSLNRRGRALVEALLGSALASQEARP